MAQSVKHLVLAQVTNLGFGSGHDLPVRGIEPRVWLCADNAEPVWDSFSLPLRPPLTRMFARLLSLSLKMINVFF